MQMFFKNLFRSPLVRLALIAIFGIVAWQTGSLLAVLGIASVAYFGWGLAQGKHLHHVVLMPVALWAGGYGAYNAIQSGSSISVSIVSAISYIAFGLYLVWLVPIIVSKTLGREKAADGHGPDIFGVVLHAIAGLVVVWLVVSTLNSIVS